MSRTRSSLISLIPPILFVLFPLLAINMGWLKVQSGDFERRIELQRDRAREVLDSMSQSWSFRDQFSRLCGEFHRNLEEIFTDEKSGRTFLPLISRSAQDRFSAPFPSHEVWVFQYPEALSPSGNAGTTGTASEGVSTFPQLIYSESEVNLSKRSLSMAFHHLMQKNAFPGEVSETSLQAKTAHKILQSIFGPTIQPDVLALSQPGYPTPVIFNHQQMLLFWNSFRAGKNLLGGFAVLVPETSELDRHGMTIALQRRNSSEVGRGFIRFLSSPVGDVLDPRLASMGAFLNWVRDFRNEKSVRDIEKEGSPAAGIALGDSILFYRLLKDSTHLAVAVFPSLRQPQMPAWIWFTDLFIVFGFGFVVTRGMILNTWPAMQLGFRFAVLYFIAWSFPMSVSVLGGISYFRETSHAMLRDLQKELIAELKSIDQGRDSMQTRFLAAQHALLKDPVFCEKLEVNGLSDPDLLEYASTYFRREPFYRKFLREGIRFLTSSMHNRFSEMGLPDPDLSKVSWIKGLTTPFGRGELDLPLSLISMFDYKGNRIASYSNSTANLDISGMLRFFGTALVQSLEIRSARQTSQELKKSVLCEEDKIFLEVYEGMSNVKAFNMIEEYRGVQQPLFLGREFLVKLHDLINIDGIDHFALMIAWRNLDIEKMILSQIGEEFLRRHAGSLFMPYCEDKGRVVPLWKTSQTHEIFLTPAVNQAGKLSGILIRHDENLEWMTIVAPSRSNSKNVYAAGVSTKPIFDEINTKIRFLFSLGLLSSFSALLLFIWTAQRIISPVKEMEPALKLIQDGNLNQRIQLDRPDELGHLSRTFNTMVDGLRKRRRISRLVSKKAIELMSRTENLQEAISGNRATIVTLVSDIRNFTSLCETKSVRVITSLLNRHFKEMEEIIRKHGGTIDRFIGDAIQAFFEETTETNAASCADRAISAGLEMLNKLEGINKLRQRESLFPYSIGIGIARGEAILGAIGDASSRLDYLVLGSSMKRSAHLEALSKHVPYCPLVISPEVAKFAAGFGGQFESLTGFEDDAMVLPDIHRNLQLSNDI